MGEIIGRTESEIDRLWILEIKRVVRASSQGGNDTNEPVTVRAMRTSLQN